MEIIKCTMEELDAVAAFYDKVVDYLVRHVNYPKWRPGEYPAYGSVKENILNGSQYACIGEGKVLGAFALNDNPQGDYSMGKWRKQLSEGEYLIIHTLATDPDIYKSGAARFMVEYCIEFTKKRGYKAVRLDVVPGNDPAERLYESMGFLFAGQADIARGFDDIPIFDLYELNFTD